MKLQAWEEGRLPDCWGQCLSRRRVLGGLSASLSDPHVTSICLTSDSELPVQPVCNPDSRTSPGTNQIVILGLGRIRVGQNQSWCRATKATLISVFSHTVWNDTLRAQAAWGLEVLNRLWEVGSGRPDGRQSAPSYPYTHSTGGWFQPDPAKVVEAENIIQNPFSWAG